MILDIIILIILIIPMAMGLFRGFMYMLMRVLGWVGAMIAAFFLTGPLSRAMNDGFVGEMVSGSLSERFGASVDTVETATQGLPDIVSGGLTVAAGNALDVFVALMTSMIVSVISFFIIMMAVKLIARVLVRPAARRRDRSLLTGMDKLLGMIIGFAEGILLVFVFLALLVPVVNFADAGTAADIVENLESSVIAGSLYDNNMLLLITGGIFS